MNLKSKMIDNKIKSIYSFLKVNLLSTTLLILFNNMVYCQEFKDSLPSSNILKTFHFKRVHRDTIYKIEKIIYISKDTCPEKYFNDMHSIFNKCPSSETISLKYVRNKRVWISINADKVIEKGKFNKGKKLYGNKLLNLCNRYPRFVTPYGLWTFYSKTEDVTLIKRYND